MQPSSGGEGSPTAGRPGEGTSAAEEQSEPRKKAGREHGSGLPSALMSKVVAHCGGQWTRGTATTEQEVMASHARVTMW